MSKNTVIISFSLLVFTTSLYAAPSMSLYGNFHSMGITITVDAGDDPDNDATASVEYKTGAVSYRTGFPMSRIDGERFVGSLFYLEPGKEYDVRVTFSQDFRLPFSSLLKTICYNRFYSL